MDRMKSHAEVDDHTIRSNTPPAVDTLVRDHLLVDPQTCQRTDLKSRDDNECVRPILDE